jgi:hypothetical protein
MDGESITIREYPGYEPITLAAAGRIKEKVMTMERNPWISSPRCSVQEAVRHSSSKDVQFCRT